MHDQTLVGVMDRTAHFHKSFQAVFHAELMRIAILVDVYAFDVIHHQVRQPVLGGAPVDQAHDLRMI
jgi:hypothetical protein